MAFEVWLDNRLSIWKRLTHWAGLLAGGLGNMIRIQKC
jgi:hypothetical protein